MKHQINKKRIKQTFFTFIIILSTNYIINLCIGNFSKEGYQKYYHKDEGLIAEYIYESRNDLFGNYEKSISVDKYPKTYNEYLKINPINKKQLFPERKFKIKYLKNIDYNNPKNKHIQFGYCFYHGDKLYYNQYGNLIAIERTNSSNKKYIYDINGKLFEAEWNKYTPTRTNIEITYTSDKELKYFYEDNSGRLLINNHISFCQYIHRLNLNILITSIILLILFLIFTTSTKVTEEYLNSFNHLEHSNNILERIYFHIFKNKTHLWSHFLMLCGFLFIIPIKNYYEDSYLEYFIFVVAILGIIIYISTIIIYILEKYLFKSLKIKYKFVYKNPLYNIIWLTGQLLALSPIYLILIMLFLILIGHC